MRKVEVNLQIKTAPEKVIKAFTDPGMLNDWWKVERTLIDKRVGGLYTLTWKVTEQGIGYVSSGIIEKYDPQKELVIGNFVYLSPDKPFLGPMKMTLEVAEKDGMTDLYLRQDGYQYGEDWDWYYEAVKEAWPTAMQDFKAYLEAYDG